MGPDILDFISLTCQELRVIQLLHREMSDVLLFQDLAETSLFQDVLWLKIDFGNEGHQFFWSDSFMNLKTFDHVEMKNLSEFFVGFRFFKMFAVYQQRVSFNPDPNGGQVV